MRKRSLSERLRGLRLPLAITMAAVAAGAITSAGQANFTSSKCQGANVTGRGASFANAAHAGWKTNFQNNYCADVGSFPTMTYDPAGSGAGRRAVGERTGSNADGSQSRNQVPRFGMSDEPPSPTGQSQMNQGTDAAGDEGIVHVIPAAVGSVVMAVNFPNNCDRSLLPDSAETDPASANVAPFIDRVRFTRTQWEAVWNGDSSSDNWTEVFPSLAADADCNVSVTRVVRFDDSGTSFAYKDFLDRINPGRGWLTTFTTPDTRTWPNASVGPRADCGGATGPQGTNLTSACSNGNGPLVQKLLTVDGGVGYSDIATARTNGYAITPAASAGSRDDDIFWTQGPNQGGSFSEPTEDANGFRTDGSKGANCENAAFSGVPATGTGGLDRTTGDWSQVSGVDSANAYVVCTLTYGLVFDDSKSAYALQPVQVAEESKARTVKDYWTSILTNSGQSTLYPGDYAPLPVSLLQIARDGVNSVCWNKAAGACTATNFGHDHPKDASPLTVSLVPSFRQTISTSQCTARGGTNSSHGPPLAFASCNPPAFVPGTVAHFGVQASGSASLTAVPGNLATVADEADVAIATNLTDIRSGSATGADYDPSAGADSTLVVKFRVNDFLNGVSQTDSGTVADFDFNVPVNCTATGGSLGATCSTTTTADAVSAGAIKEGRQMVIQAFRIRLNDAGSNGTRGDADDRNFAMQGIYIP